MAAVSAPAPPPSAAYGPLLERVFAWAFGPVAVPADAGPRLRALAGRGTVVYVGRSAALVTFLFFQHLCLRLGAPVAEAVVGLAAQVWRPWWRPWAGRARVRAPHRDDVVSAVARGASALVFLHRPGPLLGPARDVPDPFPALVAAQRGSERPILLVPQLVIWERRPRHLQKSLMEALFGAPEAPGFWRSLGSFLWNRRRAFVRFGEPIDLGRVVADSPGLDDRVIARKVRGALAQHLARQTRVVTGPPLKAPERVIVETLRDRTLRGTLADIARERGGADTAVAREAEKCLREIAARQSPGAIELMKWLMDWVFDRIYDGVDVDEEGIARIARAAAEHPIVVCPSHKSHVDYLIMSYAFYVRGLIPPHIAAGVNLSFWPLGPVFRRGGAFFIRRTIKGDRVYAAVLAAYVRQLVKDGASQEFFVEGGRSRTGKVLMPKFGMLAMEVDAWVEGARPDIVFCPAWVGYEQIIEAGAYADELAGGEKKPEDLGALLRTSRVLRSRYGRIHLRFDEPLSLARLAADRGFDRATHSEDDKRALVRALGFRIIEGINRVTALTPSGLLCTALLAHDRRGLDTRELVDRMKFLLQLARDAGARTTFTPDDAALDPTGAGPVREACAALERAKALIIHDAAGERIFEVVARERMTLDYHKNTALHFFVPDAVFATALLTGASGEARAEVEARALALSRLFKQEFVYAMGSFSELFERRLSAFIRLGLVEVRDGALAPTAAGTPRVRLLAELLVNYVEAYVAAAEALSLLLAGPEEAGTVVRKGLERARVAYLAGRIRRFESLSKVTFENALALFEEQGVLLRQGARGKQLALAPAFASEAALAAHVAAIRAFLIRAS